MRKTSFYCDICARETTEDKLKKFGYKQQQIEACTFCTSALLGYAIKHIDFVPQLWCTKCEGKGYELNPTYGDSYSKDCDCVKQRKSLGF